MSTVSESQHAMMLKTPIPKLVVRMALPSMATQLVTVAYNTADTYFVSQISTSASAAVGVVLSLMSLIQAFGGGVGMGASSLVSRRLGEKRDEEAQIITSSAFAAAILFGMTLLTFGLLFLKPLMRLLGSTETMLPYSCEYGAYILVGAPIMCSSFVLSSLLRSEGEPVLAMWGQCTGGILNVLFDPLFIFVFDMGIGGAALATVLSQAISFLILLAQYLRGKGILRLRLRSVSRDLRLYLLILRTGLPTIFRQGCASVASALMNIQAAVFGDAAVAAMTISYKIYLFVRHAIMGIGQGYQPIAGYNFGAGDYRRVKQSFLVATVIGTVVCTTSGALSALFPEAIIRWFRDDPEVVRIGATALRFGAAVMPFMAYSTYVNQLYQCLGFHVPATVLACCRQGICYLPLILLLPALFGLPGVQITQPTSDLLTFLISIPFQIRFFRRVLRREQK